MKAVRQAVIDIGSNTVRLVVYAGLPRAPLPIYNEKSRVKLGACLAGDGVIDKTTMKKALAALAPHLPERARSKALASALAAARRMYGIGNRAAALAAMSSGVSCRGSAKTSTTTRQSGVGLSADAAPQHATFGGCPAGCPSRPMPLPTSQATRLLKHRRQIDVQIYARDDGLWEADARLSDVKAHPSRLATGVRPAGEPIHDMLLRLVIAMLVAMGVIRLVVYGLRQVFSPAGWLSTFELLIGLTIWSAWVLHALATVVDISGVGSQVAAARFGFAPCLQERKRLYRFAKPHVIGQAGAGTDL